MNNTVLSILTFVVPFATSIISAIISYILGVRNTKKTIELELKDAKEKQMYEIKKQAIFKALDFLNNYISWLTLEVTAIRNDATPKDMTLQARKVYDELRITVNSADILKSFTELVFGKKEKPFDDLKNFLIAARKELSLNEIELDNDKLFIAVISTDALNKEALSSEELV